VTEIEALRTEAAILRHQLERANECCAAIDAFGDSAIEATMSLVNEFANDPATQARLRSATASFLDRVAKLAMGARNSLPMNLN
jgi:hypothetical protein